MQVAEPFTHSAGFGGLFAVVGAVLAAGAAVVTVVQRTRADNRAAWWDRFTWVVDRLGDDLGGPLALAMFDQLATAAHRLHDDRLVEFVTLYVGHVYDDVLSPSPGSDASVDTGSSKDAEGEGICHDR